MNHHCTKCGNNWAKLQSIEDEDEVYEFCPVCKTDSFLTEGSGSSYILTIDNKIVNVETGKELVKEYSTVYEEREPYYLIMQRKEQEMELRENRALDAYHKLFATDRKAAEEAYKQEMRNG